MIALHGIKRERNTNSTLYAYFCRISAHCGVFVNKHEKERLETVSIAFDVAPFSFLSRCFLMTITCALALFLREGPDKVPVRDEISFGIVEERTIDGERERKREAFTRSW